MGDVCLGESEAGLQDRIGSVCDGRRWADGLVILGVAS